MFSSINSPSALVYLMGRRIRIRCTNENGHVHGFIWFDFVWIFKTCTLKYSHTNSTVNKSVLIWSTAQNKSEDFISILVSTTKGFLYLDKSYVAFIKIWWNLSVLLSCLFSVFFSQIIYLMVWGLKMDGSVLLPVVWDHSSTQPPVDPLHNHIPPHKHFILLLFSNISTFDLKLMHYWLFNININNNDWLSPVVSFLASLKPLL